MKWSPSLRSKVIFSALACIVLLGFCLTLATLYAVEARKGAIVKRAQKLVDDRARELSQEWGRLLKDLDQSDLKTLPETEEFRQILARVIRSGDQVYVAIEHYDEKTGRVSRWVSGNVGEQPDREGQTLGMASPAEARQPIVLDGQSVGDVRVQSVPGVLLLEIQRESRQITVWLASLAVGLTVLLGLTFFLLWRIFQRHLEREHAHERLDRMAYVGTLAAGLAHEIRNPLNALSLNLDVIGEEMEDPRPDSAGRTRNVFEVVKSEIGRLNATLTNFLQFAVPRNTQMRMTDIVAVLNETVTLLQPDMRKRQVKYRFVGERSCISLADPAALRQVFWNVLLNSIEALEGREERRIEVHCRVDGGACLIDVLDSGPGIPPDQREQVFMVFHSRRPGGSGFGLAIARQVVERHEGSIWIDSLDGWGGVVHVRLPLRVGQVAATKNRDAK